MGKWFRFLLTCLYFFSLIDQIRAQVISPLDSLKLIFPLGHSAPISAIEFSPNKERLLTASLDHYLKLWDLRSGRELISQNFHNDLITSFCFVGDGDTIISADVDGRTIAWEANSARIINRFNDLDVVINDIKFLKRAKRIIALDDFGSIHVYQLENFKNIATIKVPYTDGISKIFLTDDESIGICLSEYTSDIYIIDLIKNELIRTLKGHAKGVNDIKIDNHNKLLASCAGDGFMKIWNLLSGKLLINIKVSARGVNQLILDSTKKVVFSADDEGFVSTWTYSGKLIRKRKVGNGPLKFIDNDNSSEKIIAITTEKQNKIINDSDHANEYTLLIINSDLNRVLYKEIFDHPLTNVSISLDKKYFALGSDNYFINIYDFDNNQLISTLSGNSFYPRSNSFNIFGKPYFTGFKTEPHGIYKGRYVKLQVGDNSEWKFIDIKSGNEIQTPYFDRNKKIRNVSFSADGRYLATTSDQNLTIWDLSTGKQQYTILAKNGSYFSDIIFHPQANELLLLNSNDLLIIDLIKKRITDTLHCGEYIYDAVYSPDGKNIVTAIQRRLTPLIQIWRSRLKIDTLELLGHTDEIWDIQYSPSGKYILSCSDDGNVIVWDAFTGKSLKVMKASEGRISNCYMNEDETLLLSIGFDDHFATLWDFSSAKAICQKITTYNGEEFIKLPNSLYYMCSKEISKSLHYVTPTLKIIGFDQLDPIYNRPDVVLDSISRYIKAIDHKIIQLYRDAFRKRLNRIGLSVNQIERKDISIPIGEIKNSTTVKYLNNSGTIKLDIHAEDNKYALLKMNVIINEVPIYGTKGISFKDNLIYKIDTSLQIWLGIGLNKIQISITNSIGLENYKYSVYVNYEPLNKIKTPRTHYIGIGIDSFVNADNNLSFCVKDVIELGDKISGQITTNKKILINRDVSLESMKKLKKYFMDSTDINDRVIISCSSHGLLDSNRNFYLATYDTKFIEPEKKAISYEILEDLLDNIPARKKMLLIDACNSGENDIMENEMEIRNETDKINGKLFESNSRKFKVSDFKQSNSSFDLMNDLFVNVKNNTGAVIISAAGGQEDALEGVLVNGQKIKNGIFTYSVMEFLKKTVKYPDMQTVNQLKKYVEKRVVQISKGRQRPMSRQETKEVDWRINEIF